MYFGHVNPEFKQKRRIHNLAVWRKCCGGIRFQICDPVFSREIVRSEPLLCRYLVFDWIGDAKVPVVKLENRIWGICGMHDSMLVASSDVRQLFANIHKNLAKTRSSVSSEIFYSAAEFYVMSNSEISFVNQKWYFSPVDNNIWVHAADVKCFVYNVIGHNSTRFEKIPFLNVYFEYIFYYIIAKRLTRPAKKLA